LNSQFGNPDSKILQDALNNANAREAIFNNPILARDPAFIKNHEVVQNKLKFDVAKMVAENNNQPIRLSEFLCKDMRYLWVVKNNSASGKPELVVGYEHDDDAGNRYGHPTLALTQTDDGVVYEKGYIAGELFHKDGEWKIDNNSGRFGSGNIDAMNDAKIGKKALMKGAAALFNKQTDINPSVEAIFSKHAVKRLIQSLV
jgi:hypothetical protein